MQTQLLQEKSGFAHMTAVGTGRVGPFWASRDAVKVVKAGDLDS